MGIRVTPSDEVCCLLSEDGSIQVEPELARKSAVAFLEQFLPYSDGPGDCTLAPRKNECLGLMAYGMYLFGGLKWELGK